jgi:hypothetical protein
MRSLATGGPARPGCWPGLPVFGRLRGWPPGDGYGTGLARLRAYGRLVRGGPGRADPGRAGPGAGAGYRDLVAATRAR